ncbi:GntR family transcriptional regulator [Anaerostipes sp.]|uniref:GntR family transcriptional regulator n=1 Tax=Anaerostipes sp. TaxID=1872530 RepID=UPI0025BF8AD2|nr:GntR family transcriptional regulator [Anaerostipes sp.]MBS7009941.1 GntR family transcriptional regulator [Anaerostipes sp.]
MENSIELRQVVYSVLLTQIRFGVYHFGEKLPTIEETSTRFHVSVDTARAAYLKLKNEGYITLEKNVGAAVKVRYNSHETEQFIQTFFAMRKASMIDLANAMGPLFSNAQWFGLRYASKEMLMEMERLSHEKNTAPPYAMLEHLSQKYRALGNSLLMGLTWQTFMFLFDPFFSIKDNLRYFDGSANYLPTLLKLCREKNWSALRDMVDQSIKSLPPALTRFYEAKITAPSPEKEIPFVWTSYKKSQQLCYSFSMELLISISRGIYPVGSLLPSQKELAEQKGVSLSTVRRSFELLSSVGAIKPVKYVGTSVLPFDKATENSDFTNPVLQRRLLDLTESLQIFALSCKEVSMLTLSSLDLNSVKQLCQKLKANRERRRGETISYFILDWIAKSAPYQAIRTVYSELLLQFFWSYAFRGLQGKQETINAIYEPYFDTLIESLNKRDFPRFSVVLEELVNYEFCKTMDILSRLGIPGAEHILIPDKIIHKNQEKQETAF